MTKISALHFFPERIAWMGVAILTLGCLLTLPLVIILHSPSSSYPILSQPTEKESSLTPLAFSLPLSEGAPTLPTLNLEEEMTMSFDPPRPIGAFDSARLLVKMNRTNVSKRVVLPCRLDLAFRGEDLTFSKAPSSFWADLSMTADGRIEGKGFITSLQGKQVEIGHFLLDGQDCPIQTAQELPEMSPFRLLAEARWWGRDQFKEPQDCGERLEIGTAELLELKEGEWLIWKDQQWKKSQAPEQDLPIAHIQSAPGKTLILEGWDADGHVRLSLGTAASPPFKMRAEDLFTSLRIRSEKQISCMLEKQCMVLKIGDWVLKENGRWKTLRKKEERDAFINGKLIGELFVFEHIAQKQGQKMMQGQLFNAGRTQVIPIEMAAQATRPLGSRSGDKSLTKRAR